MKATLGQCAEWVGGRLIGEWDLPIAGVCADSRLAVENALFVGIAGPNFDGNDFVTAAAENGCVAALVRDERFLHGLPGIVVADTISGLGALAAGYRRERQIPWIAITGSNGKTTTREVLACILRSRGPIACSTRNYNNNIGVPLSVLSAPDNAWAGVVEIGTNLRGEIAALARLVQPQVAIVTSIGSAHLEGLGSPKGVAEEKGSLFEVLPSDGLAVFSSEVQYRHVLEERVHCQRRLFSLEGHGDIFAEGIGVTESGLHFAAWATPFDVALLGRHNVGNVLGAVAAADWIGVTPAEAAAALRGFRPVGGRLCLRKCGPIRVLDDTYNANPDSLCAAIQVLGELPAKRRVAIVGAMGELGPSSARLHRESGYLIAREGVDLVLATGASTVELAEAAATGAASCRVHYFPSVGALLPRLPELVQAGDLVLVKGSRASRMEKVVGRIEHLYGKQEREGCRGTPHA